MRSSLTERPSRFCHLWPVGVTGQQWDTGNDLEATQRAGCRQGHAEFGDRVPRRKGRKMRESGSVPRQHSITVIDSQGLSLEEGLEACWGWRWGDRLTFPRGESWRHQLGFIPKWKTKASGENKNKTKKQKTFCPGEKSTLNQGWQHSNFIVF